MRFLALLIVAVFAVLLFFVDRKNVNEEGAKPLHLQEITKTQTDELVELGNPLIAARERVDERKRSEIVLATHPVATLDAETENLRDEIERLQKANDLLAFQLLGARNELLLLGSEMIDGPIADWIAHAPEDRKPTQAQVYMVSDMLVNFPIRMTEAEAAWIGERTKRNDWKQYAPTISEAVIGFLGAGRIASEVTPNTLAQLREEWSEEGYFAP